jgi:hypothetical protein
MHIIGVVDKPLPRSLTRRTESAHDRLAGLKPGVAVEVSPKLL